MVAVVPPAPAARDLYAVEPTPTRDDEAAARLGVSRRIARRIMAGPWNTGTPGSRFEAAQRGQPSGVVSWNLSSFGTRKAAQSARPQKHKNQATRPG
ncbi:hypothetical protein Aph02nite_22260 [Actinoplanes philippinensis]|nr:hypothetical protein Aph02nite_22260 [Actinoplanes philippinensis]